MFRPRLLLTLLLLLQCCAPAARSEEAVDLELALLVDVSASVNAEEFALQARGLASAFRSPAVLAAVEGLAGRGIAVSIIQWADDPAQRIAIDWSLIRQERDLLWLAAQAESMPRLIPGGHTALSSALDFAAREIQSNSFTGFRKTIDLSSDGRNNGGRPLRTVRREVLAQGITINGLAILNELPQLDQYFRDNLIGGNGAFFLVAQDYRAFAQAMTEKLVREIGHTPLSKRQDRGHLKRVAAGNALP